MSVSVRNFDTLEGGEIFVSADSEKYEIVMVYAVDGRETTIPLSVKDAERLIDALRAARTVASGADPNPLAVADHSEPWPYESLLSLNNGPILLDRREVEKVQAAGQCSTGPQSEVVMRQGDSIMVRGWFIDVRRVLGK